MKGKSKVLALCLGAVTLSALLLFGCTTFFPVSEDNSATTEISIAPEDSIVSIYCSKFMCTAFAGEFEYDPAAGAPTEIVVPDEYNGYAVEQLGGYYGTGVPVSFRACFPFYYDICNYIPDIGMICHRERSPEVEPLRTAVSEADVRTVIFYVSIGKNISSIEMGDNILYYMDSDYAQYPEPFEGAQAACTLYASRDTEAPVYYLPLYYFDCDENNLTYYSEDGRLYLRADNSLVKAYDYWNSEILAEFDFIKE